MQQSALYFPYVRIRDDEWLKVAALYWPSVRRLVPPGYRKHDSETARALAEAELLRDEVPKELLTFFNWDLLEVLEANADRLVQNFGLSRARSSASVPVDHVDAPFDTGNLGWIHCSKFPPGVRQFLQHNDLTCSGSGADSSTERDDSPGWVGMHPALARAYMTALAQQLSEAGRFEPLTDQDDLRVATPTSGVRGALSLLVGNPGAISAQDVGLQTYVMLAFQYARPRNVAEIPVEKIIKCRRELKQELEAFSAHVDAQRAELAAIAATPIPKRQLEDFARHVEATVEVPLQRLEHGLELHALQPTRSLVMASAVSPPAAVGAAVTGHPMAATAVGTVAAVGGAWWQIEEQRSAARKASPVGYLLDVRDHLTPRTLMARVRRVLTGTYGVGHR